MTTVDRVAGRERPMIFSAESVRAILDGRKRMTRRVLRNQTPTMDLCMDVAECRASVIERCPHGAPGDTLWIRETWGCTAADHPLCKDGRKPTLGDKIVYQANEADAWQWRGGPGCGSFVWRSPIHMPRWASRLTLEIVEVRVERLSDISEEDAKAEGARAPGDFKEPLSYFDGRDFRDVTTYREVFRCQWNAINGKRAPWDSNPFCWVISFKPVSSLRQDDGT